MKGYARINTEAVSGPHRVRVVKDKKRSGRSGKESAKRSTGESRLIELQKNLDKAKIVYTTAFGLDGAVEVYWGGHLLNVDVEVDEETNDGENHIAGCVCADCNDAELTAEND